MRNYQRVIAEINMDVLAFNMHNIRKRTSKNAQIMAIVKADAYGHGAVEVSKVLLENGADWLAVAVIDEAIQLRKNGITAPILILGYTHKSRFEDVVNYDIVQTNFSYEEAELLSQVAKKCNKSAKIHIKIDTGMSRIGFLPNNESIDEIMKISKLDYIDVNGIFTHFASADELDKEFTINQGLLFSSVIDELEKRGLYIPVKHASNSAGIMDFDDLFFTMVRPGIILYGLYPSDCVNKDNLDIKPVMSIKTHVSHVKVVDAGTPIGYGRTYTTSSEIKIATIPVGYADGYIRGMQKGGRVIIGGEYAPIVGRICMDQFMVDVTNIKDVSVGDDVVMLGKQGDKEITADEIANVIDTINYEVICLVAKRVPRVYMKNNEITKIINYIV